MNIDKRKLKPYWIEKLEEQGKRVFATDKGWVMCHDNGYEELIYVMKDLKEKLSQFDDDNDDDEKEKICDDKNKFKIMEFTAKEIKDMYGITDKELKKMREAGEIEYKKKGKSYIYYLIEEKTNGN